MKQFEDVDVKREEALVAERSNLPRVVGVGLLLEILGESRSRWAGDFLASTDAGQLESDEAFVGWILEEYRRDPSLVSRLRQVLVVCREDLQRGLFEKRGANSVDN